MVVNGITRVKKAITGPVWSLAAKLSAIQSGIAVVQRRMNTLAVIERERYVKDVLSAAKYQDLKRVTQCGYKVYSQNDEDGIIQEIFKRIGCKAKTFVEFGVENGLENNTLKLLLEGWSGLWLEGSGEHVASIQKKFPDVISEGRLSIKQAFIDKDNINDLIQPHYEGDLDLLSIDIDGNDIYILQALTVVKPRVIIVEYNGKFPPPMSIAQAYNAEHRWRGTDYGGSSLTAIVKVAAEKNYSLVGCNVMGVNAFFVRNDLIGDSFCGPFTAENHYEPARYFLWQTFVAGHEADWGPYVQI